jgi:hypothetical protein
MNTPANKWREEFDAKYINGDFGITTCDPHVVPLKALKDFIQKTLDQHSSHLVKRIEKEKRQLCEHRPHDSCDSKCSFQGYDEEYNHGLDQAIDIVKGNK